MAFRPDLEVRRAAAAVDLARTGGENAPVEIVEYDPAWAVRFADESARLARVVPHLRLHHIGSTAVPGLAAKPVIDMMALVADLDAPVPALIEAGYEYPEACNAVLAGRRWLCRPSASHRRHHLHLVADPRDLERHLRFRDALRADPRLAADYAGLKRDLAARFADDREGYGAAKTTFIDGAIGDR